MLCPVMVVAVILAANPSLCVHLQPSHLRELPGVFQLLSSLPVDVGATVAWSSGLSDPRPLTASIPATAKPATSVVLRLACTGFSYRFRHPGTPRPMSNDLTGPSRRHEAAHSTPNRSSGRSSRRIRSYGDWTRHRPCRFPVPSTSVAATYLHDSWGGGVVATRPGVPDVAREIWDRRSASVARANLDQPEDQVTDTRACPSR